MIQKIAGALILTLALGTMVSAQDTRIEISPFFGYTLSEGFTVNPNTVAGIIVDKVNPTSGISYGVMFNVNVNENMQVGFLYDNQESNLELKGRGVLGKVNAADLKVRNYHGIFTYNWGDSRDSTRPYIFGGLGATQYSPGDVMGFAIDGETKFSSTWGGGVKFFASPHFAINIMGRWTPTYIKSDPGGIWCSPYWPGGCWQLSEPDYSNQLQFAGGVTFAF
ncbi:MAG: hypothetical protein BMS9Abin37_0468 [Acidobacteriota bacterium]|nr:MAG: hypothetical protein BMS9Abin37_0468 [Acidobacteriota bacterium]